VVEAGRGVHEAEHVHDLLNAIEITERVLHRRQRRDRGIPRRLTALLQGQVLADDARQVRLSVLARRGARQIEQVLDGEVRDVMRARDITAIQVFEARQLEPELRELVFYLHVCLPPSAQSERAGVGPGPRSVWRIGGGEGSRTLDLGVANAALSQLSYAPASKAQVFYTRSAKPPNPARHFVSPPSLPRIV